MSRIPALALLLLLPACLQSEQSVTIAADGSGTQSLTLALTDEVLGVARQYVSVADASGPRPRPEAVFEEPNVRRELREAGLALTRFDVRVEHETRVLDVTASFPGVAELRRSPLGGTRAQWFFLAAEGDLVRAVYYPQGKEAYEQAGKKLEALKQNGMDDAMRSWFEKQKQRVRGLDVRLTLRLPGPVRSCSSNWAKTDERTLGGRVTAASIATPEDLIRMLAPRYEATFDGKGCRLPLDAAEPQTR